VFSSVLIANRGEIACRVVATCEKLGVRTIAVYSEADASAPHVRAASEAHFIGPAPALQSYLNVASLLHVIRESGADAVHPGYGFLSENAQFARALESASVAFVGPRSQALQSVSDKLGARRLAQQVGFEPVPGSFASVSVAESDALMSTAERIGYPVLVKSAGGGGGIGMQRVNDANELMAASERAEGIAQRAFADKRVYLEKCIERPRHVEIQALRARDGAVFVLGSRECSVQRRYQKLIEECPSPSLTGLGRERLGELEVASGRLLDAVDYVGVATIELLLDQAGKAYFLEVNARLQVEHTVTEQVHGVDLVEIQLRLAAGEDVSAVVNASQGHGHAIEARVYAEDPQRGFLPQPGVVETLELPRGAGIRVDCGIENASTISPHYDPLLAKIIASGSSRQRATERLLDALGSTCISVVSKNGPRVNNLALLREVLRSAEWHSGAYDTGLVRDLLVGS